MRYSKGAANLVQGVSQQADFMRDVSQCEEQINMIPDAATGLAKRLGTEFSGELPSDISQDAKFHFINRDNNEKYLVVIDKEAEGNPRLRVFDIEGNEKVVNASAEDLAYLGSEGFDENLVLRTVADNTFFVNKQSTCQLVKTPEKYIAGLLGNEGDIPITRRDITITFNTVAGQMPWRQLQYHSAFWTESAILGIEDARFGETPSINNGSGFDNEADSHVWWSGVRFPELVSILEDLLKELGYGGVSSDGVSTVYVKGYPKGQLFPELTFHKSSTSSSPVGETNVSWEEVENCIVTTEEEAVIGWIPAPDTDVNNDVGSVVEKTPEPVDLEYGMFFVKQGDYETNYHGEFKIDGEDEGEGIWRTLFNITSAPATPEEGDEGLTGRAAINTDVIAEDIRKTVSEGGGVGSFQVGIQGNVVVIWRADGKPFSIRSSDGLGGNGLNAIKGKTTSITDLPEDAWENFRVKISGAVGNISDDYYVIYSQDGSLDENGAGSWVETVAPKSGYAPHAASMPHKLVSEDNEVFTFMPMEWKARDAGDKYSNPDPSFIGSSINDIFFYNNRLALLTNESVIFSQADDYEDFFRKTVRTALADDVIDVIPDSDRVTYLHSAASFQGNLYLLSNNIQFKLTNQGALTADTLQIKPISYYQLSNKASAVSSGKLMFMPEKRLGFTAVREYFVDTANELEDAMDATEHVPTYIEGDTNRLALSIGKDALLLGTTFDDETFYLHKFLWKGAQKIQAAWCKVTFGGQVEYLSEMDNKFLFVINREGTRRIETWTPSGTEDNSRGFKNPLHVDSLEYVSEGSPIKQQYIGKPVVAFDKNGVSYNFEGGRTAILDGDGNAAFDIAVGYPFDTLYTLTKLRLKDREGQPIQSKRNQLASLFVEVADSGSFTVETKAKGKAPLKFESSPLRMGVQHLFVGQKNLITDSIKVPLRANAADAVISITSTDELPLRIEALEWIGTAKRN